MSTHFNLAEAEVGLSKDDKPRCIKCGNFIDDCTCVCPYCGETVKCTCCVGTEKVTGGG